MTHILLIAKPGLIGNSLLVYCRSLVNYDIRAEHVEPADYLAQDGQVTADVLLILEEENPKEIDQVLKVAAATRQRAVVIVNDINRQRVLRMTTEYPVLIWSLIDQSLAQHLFAR